jgi:hypothetical protein
MINLAQMEVWFVPGSQHLYGPEILTKVQDLQASNDRFRFDPPLVPGGWQLRQLRRADLLDAHLLACPDVDRRATVLEQTFAPSTHTIQ